MSRERKRISNIFTHPDDPMPKGFKSPCFALIAHQGRSVKWLRWVRAKRVGIHRVMLRSDGYFTLSHLSDGKVSAQDAEDLCKYVSKLLPKARRLEAKVEGMERRWLNQLKKEKKHGKNK